MKGLAEGARHTLALIRTFEGERNVSGKRLICKVFNRVLFVRRWNIWARIY